MAPCQSSPGPLATLVGLENGDEADGHVALFWPRKRAGNSHVVHSRLTECEGKLAREFLERGFVESSAFSPLEQWGECVRLGFGWGVGEKVQPVRCTKSSGDGFGCHAEASGVRVGPRHRFLDNGRGTETFTTPGPGSEGPLHMALPLFLVGGSGQCPALSNRTFGAIPHLPDTTVVSLVWLLSTRKVASARS